MALINHIPELAADGGYWHAVEAKETTEYGGVSYTAPMDGDWAGYYADINGVRHVAVRTDTPRLAPENGASIAQIITPLSQKPPMRVGG